MRLQKEISIHLGRFLRRRSVQIVLLVTLALGSFYFGFFNHIEPSWIGIARNRISGEIWKQEAGWHITPPWVWVVAIDTRPMRIGVPTAGHGFSAKLVQFDETGWHDFVQIEGWRYYWWSNRFSVNFGYDDEYRGMKDILRAYAYSPNRYPFLKVLEEIKQ